VERVFSVQFVALVSRARAVATTAVMLAVAVLSSSTGAPGAAGAPRTAPCNMNFPLVRHLVLFEVQTTVDTAQAEIDAACGALAGYYPEIAVAVAVSADAAFADRLGRDRAYSAQAEEVTRLPRRMPATLPRAMGIQSVGLAAAEPAPGTVFRTGRGDRSDEQWDMTMIGADRARAQQRGNGEVLVGVLDSGIDADHPELSAALDRSASASCVSGVPDPSPQAWQPSGDHGTHVAGIIAAADDGVGVSGIAPSVRIAAVKVVDSAGFIYPEYAVCGFLWAARSKIRIANHSYLVDPWLFTCRGQPGQSVVHEALHRAARYANAQGVLSIAAVGNEALDLAAPRVDIQSPTNTRRPQPRPVDNRCDVLPAELPDVLTVSAVGAAGLKASYSSYGADVVHLTAPGGDVRQRSPSATSGCVLSTVPGGYGRMCGTSMATPHVTGVAALAASVYPWMGSAELASLVVSSATPVACPGRTYDPDSDGAVNALCVAGGTGNGFYGAGLVNAVAVLG
jgi:subtilisin family serine protease